MFRVNLESITFMKVMKIMYLDKALVYNRYDRYFKNRADYGLIGIWSVSANFLLLPIFCTDFNNVGVSQKSAKITQKNVGKTLK